MTARATATTTPRRGRGHGGPAAAAASTCLLLLLLLLSLSAEAFQGCGVVRTTAKASSSSSSSPLFLNNKASEATKEGMDGLTYPARVAPIQRALATSAAWMTAAVVIPAASAWAAAAASSSSEADEYVYGSVDAPVGLAVGAGILAIATAALPVLLRGGEEAFEEIRERDEGTFGSPDKNKDVLKSRRK
jgi:hypothetical protein